MRKLRTTAATLMAAGLLFTPATVAHSATSGAIADPTGDVTETSIDITSLEVTNSLTEVVVEVVVDGTIPALTDASWEDEGGDRNLLVNLRPNLSPDDETPTFVVRGDTDPAIYQGVNRVGDVTVAITGGNTITLTADANDLGIPARVDAVAEFNHTTETDTAIADDADVASVLEPVTAQEPGGHYLLGSDGGVFTIGDAQFYGSTGAMTLNEPVVGLAKNPHGNGYWSVAADGGVFTFGPSADIQFHGSQGANPLNQPVVGMAPNPTGTGGYWLVAADGGIFTHGDADFWGSTGDIMLNQPIVAMAPTPSGEGYYLVAADGGVFAFGDATFVGSMGGTALNKGIVDIHVDADNDGYTLLAADGGVFNFNSDFRGSAAGDLDNFGISAAALLPATDGYRIVTDNGAVVAFSGTGAFDYGSLVTLGVDNLNGEIVDASDS